MDIIPNGETLESVNTKLRSGIFINKPPKIKKRAAIWADLNEIFRSETDEQIKGYVMCTKCRKVMRYNSKTLGTNHLTNHLKSHDSGSHSMDEFVKKRKNLGQADKEMILKSCINFVGTDLRPYSAINGNGLIVLLQTFMKLGSIYGTLEISQIKELLPSIQTISRQVENSGKELKMKIYTILRNTLMTKGCLPITIDIWQDKFKRISYLGMTAHYYEEKDSKTILVDKTICMKPLEPGVIKNHTFIRNQIIEKLKEIGIDDFFKKIVYITDRGSNIRKALCDTQRLNCFPHFLNNVVKSACEIDVVKDIIDRTKSLVRYFKITGLNNKLRTALKSSCPTRFNSILFTFESITDNWSQINDTLRSLNELERLNNINYSDLKHIAAYLKEFEIWTKLSSASNTPSLYTIWIGIHAIMQHSHINDNEHSIVSLMKVKAFTYIENKFVLSKLHRIATFLHPSYKSLKFASFGQIEKTHAEIREELRSFTNTNNSDRRSSTSSESSISQFADCYDDNDEIMDYLQYKCCVKPEEIDLLSWWQNKSNEFPILSKIALNYHAIPGSSTPSERLFSTSGNIITDKRSRLSPESIENLLILHDSKKYGN